MKLSKLGYLLLRDRKMKQLVADVAGVTLNTVYAWVKTDSDNLTKAGILEAISRETGVTREQLLDHNLQHEAA